MKITVDDPAYGAQESGTTGTIAGTAAGAAVAGHAADPSDAHDASSISILDPTNVRFWPMLGLMSGTATAGNYFGADNVEGALAEIGAALATLGGTVPRYWPMLSLSSAASGSIGSHLTDPTDAHDASAISIADAGALYVATDVEGALQELLTDPSRVWMPLTTVTGSSPARHWPMLALSSDALAGGVPELVWDADNSLIPSLVPI